MGAAGMRVAVSGGAGFIGSHLCEHLAAAGHPVIAIDDLSRGRRQNLPPGIPLEVRGIGDPALAERLAAFAPQALVHLAAQVDARRSLEDPVFDAQVNILDTVRLFAAAVAAGVERIVFASSAAVYGDPEEIPTPEAAPLAPLSPYGVAKLAGEGYLAHFARRHGIAGVALRFANVYGPRQETVGEAGVVAVFCQRLLAGEEVTIHGDGRQTRDFVYVEDVCKVNLWFWQNPQHSGIFNCGTGRAEPFQNVAEAVIRHHQKGAIEYIPFPDHLKGRYQSFTQADMTKLRGVGYDAEFKTVAEGVADYMAWLNR